jgi:U4/U6.U5 tri-snRNP-associated protein 1
MDAETLAQFNKLRASLGQAPLPIPGAAAGGAQFKTKEQQTADDSQDDLSTLEKRAAAADGNWENLEKERRQKRERDERKQAAKKARDLAARQERLTGTTLGEADSTDGLDTRSWLLKAKKRQKEIEKARKVEEEFAAREEQAQYTSKDLAGVKVAHEAEAFDEMTDEQILTLKDAEIGEESEDDELENAELKAKEKTEENLLLKKRRPDYDPTDQSEKKNILYKYDEEIDGKRSKQFTLDGQGSSNRAEQRRMEDQERGKSKSLKISLDMLQDEVPTSDYAEAVAIKVKKPKKSKKEKKSRSRFEEEFNDSPAQTATLASPQPMDTSGPVRSDLDRRPIEFDDEDLQAKLAEQRRQALKKRKRTDAAEVARKLREEMEVDEDDDVQEGGLVIDETTEFVANLNPVEAEPAENLIRSTSQPRRPDELGRVDDEGDVKMEQESYAAVEDEEERAQRARREASTSAELTTTGLDNEETMIGQGIAASLNMLRKRGVVSSESADDLAEKERQRTKFLTEKQRFLDEFDAKAKREREEDRRTGRFDNMSKKDRDAHQQRQNEQREIYAQRQLAEAFSREYKPDVKLKYTDEYGRDMNQKEAFKHLSHMFHGKGSGKQKTEKRLKKIDDEKKSMAKGVLNVGDAEGGMMNVQGREGKRQKTAGVRLQ